MGWETSVPDHAGVCKRSLALQVQVLAEAFKCARVTALAWVHLLLLDIVQARCVNKGHKEWQQFRLF